MNNKTWSPKVHQGLRVSLQKHAREFSIPCENTLASVHLSQVVKLGGVVHNTKKRRGFPVSEAWFQVQRR